MITVRNLPKVSRIDHINLRKVTEESNRSSHIQEASMSPTLRAGIVLGLVIVVWTFVMGFTGWYKDPMLQALFWAVILFQIVILVWGLRLTAREGKTYGGQIAAGLFMSLIGGAIAFVGSYIFTTMAFPEYFEEVRLAGEELFRSQGMSEIDIQARLDMMAASQTPSMQAFLGFIGTTVTGVIVSLILAIFIRSKSQPDAPAQS